MILQEIISRISPVEIIGTADINVTGVNIDSRSIEKGHLFIAMRGTQMDGHRFISNAVEAGAVAILCEDITDPIDGSNYFLW